MITIDIPKPLSAFCDGRRNWLCSAPSIRLALEAMEQQFPNLRERVINSTGNLKRLVRIASDGRILGPTELDEPVIQDRSVQIIVGYAGG